MANSCRTDQRSVQILRGRLLATSGRGRAIREAAGLSARTLARDLKVAHSTLIAWESGRPPIGESAIKYGELLAELEAELVAGGVQP